MVGEAQHVEALRAALRRLIEESPGRSRASIGREMFEKKLVSTEGIKEEAVSRRVQRILKGDTQQMNWSIVKAIAVVCERPDRIGDLARLYVEALPAGPGADQARKLVQEPLAVVAVAPVPTVPEPAPARSSPAPAGESGGVHSVTGPGLAWWRLDGAKLDYVLCLLAISFLTIMIAMAIVNGFPTISMLVGVAAATPVLGVLAPYPWSAPLATVGLINSASGLIVFSNGLNGTYLTYLLLALALALYDEWWLGLLATTVVMGSVLLIPHLLASDRDGPLSWAWLFALFPAVVAWTRIMVTQRPAAASERDDEDGDGRDGAVAAPPAKPAPPVAPPEPEPAQAEPYNGRHLYVVEELRSMS